MQIFFQNGDLNILRSQPSPYLRTLAAHPTPNLGGTPAFFFHQNDRKGCKRDVLDTRGHFFAFLCAGDKPSGGGYHPLPPPPPR